MSAFTPTDHPVLKLPTREQALAMGEEAVKEFLAKREKLIADERDDAYRYGYVPQCWKDADAMVDEFLLTCIFGGNGAGKTWYAAWRAMRTLVEKAGSKVLFIHESEKSSIMVHQAIMWHYLPAEYRVPDTRRHRTKNITYTVKSGFADNKFVLPNGSICMFATYKQDIKDYEGTGWSLVCADENLPLTWLKTLLFRLPRCQGKFIWAFTPIAGITPSIRHITNKAETTKSLPAPLLPQDETHVPDCPPGHMPYIQRPLWKDARVIYFFSEMNPYGQYEEMKRVLAKVNKTDIERRAYGYAKNTMRGAFPQFGAVHIVSDRSQESGVRSQNGAAAPSEQRASGVGASVPASPSEAQRSVPKPTRSVIIPTDSCLLTPEFLKTCTLRHFADPASARNMFQIWVATDKDGRHYIYRDWPDAETYGDWAVPSEDSRRWDGDPGEAQPAIGLSVAEYKRLILEAEGNKWDGTKWDMCGETIHERGIDPRSGAARTIAENDGGNSLIDMFLDEQLDQGGNAVGPSMQFDPAPGLSEDEGIMAINNLLAYDQKQPVCPYINEPKLYISSACRNTIWALQNYTRHDGEKAACKDPIDTLRYFATSDPCHLTPESMATTRGGSY